MLRFSFLCLRPLNADLAFIISLKRGTLIFSYPQAGRPITPSLDRFADSSRTFPYDREVPVRTHAPQRTAPLFDHLVGGSRKEIRGRPIVLAGDRALMLTCDSARTPIPSGDHVGAFRRRPLARKTKNEQTPFEVGGPELDLRRHA